MALSKTIVEEGVLSEINFQLEYGDSSKALEVLIEYGEYCSTELVIKELDSWRDELLSLGTCGVCVVIDEMESEAIRLREKLKQ